MNTDVNEKLGALLSEKTFYEKYEGADTPEALVAAISQEIPEATYEEIDRFLTAVSTHLQSGETELSESDLDNVAGGLVVTASVLAGVWGFIKGCAIVGGALGTLYFYAKHRNC